MYNYAIIMIDINLKSFNESIDCLKTQLSYAKCKQYWILWALTRIDEFTDCSEVKQEKITSVINELNKQLELVNSEVITLTFITSQIDSDRYFRNAEKKSISSKLCTYLFCL